MGASGQKVLLHLGSQTGEARQACEDRRSIPASSALPEITTDYETNLPAAFWNWVCNRQAGDNPRGDFIRDTRDLLRVGRDSPDEVLESACAKAIEKYLTLRTRWAAEVGVHPWDCTPLDGKAKIKGSGWYYCCSQCDNCDCDGVSGCNCGCNNCSTEE